MRPLPDFTDPAQASDASLYKTYIDFYFSLFNMVGGAFGVQETSPADMTVTVAAGVVQNNTGVVAVAEQATGTIYAPITDPRIDRVVLNIVTGVVSVVTGSEDPAPSAPAVPVGSLSLAQIALSTSTTAITQNLITDERSLYAFPVLDEDTFASDSPALPPSQQSVKKAIDDLTTLVNDSIQVRWTRPYLNTSNSGVSSNECVMDGTGDGRLAVVEETSARLYLYVNNGTALLQEGSHYNIPNLNNAAICAIGLNGEVSAVVANDDPLEENIQLYIFSALTWTTSGSPYVISGMSLPTIAKLTLLTYAFFDSGTGYLRKLSYDVVGGWAQVGNALLISPATGQWSISALDDDLIVVFNKDEGKVYVYEFDGLDWAPASSGAQVTTAGTGSGSVAAINGGEFAFLDDARDKLVLYKYVTGPSNIIDTASHYTTVSGIGTPVIAAMNGKELAVHGSGAATIELYNLDFYLGSGPNLTDHF